MAAVTKVIIAFENKCIPANLNMKKLKSTIAKMCPPLHPINDNFHFTPGIQQFILNDMFLCELKNTNFINNKQFDIKIDLFNK